MKVKKAIEELQKLNPEAEAIHICVTYEDFSEEDFSEDQWKEMVKELEYPLEDGIRLEVCDALVEEGLIDY